MKKLILAAAAALGLAAFAAPAVAQPDRPHHDEMRGDRGDHDQWRDRDDRGRRDGWDRHDDRGHHRDWRRHEARGHHYGWRNHRSQYCRTIWVRHHRERVCRWR